MQIRRLLASDAVAFQKLRLFGLQESPTAFGSSYEEEVDRSTPEIAKSLEEQVGKTIFGAFANHTLLAIVAVGRETSIKGRHRGFIRSVYVEPSVRGQGIGKALMQHAMKFARTMPDLRQVTLTVTDGNHAAITTYLALGFKICGTAPEALYVDGKYYDEVQMVHLLNMI
ncbi:GNAT family N-acetyltransferase [Undibacterium sp. RTI2.1]|uniref:GNAT family N-acetyltransferase n=1 Tax=unclassified Undibacterium TaxID=2630295 RepID=UPI002B2388F2|nr:MULTISPECIES: GNAT family N-acetyltransferase [unclassified Undibacterium]MEB0032270.1 GNAT family N-acetyltransferase [Undibacterium sp. RTI2.1]MEB0118406.1 GNAT family N-acetyltransferase [Undibacterium sp. RTI2.2]